MIARHEILMGREVENPLTPELEQNLEKLLVALNVVRQAYGKPLKVTSGYRPLSFNKKAGGSKRSAHLTCEACDFFDPKGEFAKWCLANIEVLEKAGLYMEDPRFTQISDGIGWVHLQIRPTKKRVFIP